MHDEFNASYVSVKEDRESWLVGFADAEFNSKRYILLQRQRAPDARDMELGLAEYHVELDDQIQSCYGGIEALELFRDRVVIEFDDDGAFALGGDKTMVVRFELRERQLEQLRSCLSHIFSGSECFLDRSA